MIKNRDGIANNAHNIITQNIAQINSTYRGGPSLYFYLRIMDLRRQFFCVSSFLSCDNCIEILYATLVAWDMNCRGAKMKDYPENKLYGNTNESKNKFLEILEFAYDVIGDIQNPKQYFDNQWNTSETKLVDNAIIMMQLSIPKNKDQLQKSW